MIKAILFDLWNTLFYNNSKFQPAKEFADFVKNHGVKEPHDFMDRFICTIEFDSVGQAAELVCRELGCSKEEIEKILENLLLQSLLHFLKLFLH